MGATPDQLKEDIERTRAELTSDVDSLADRVVPGRVIRGRAASLRTSAVGVKDRMMGSAAQTSQATSETVGSAAGAVATTAQELPGRAVAGAQGNPLAAGLVAFGAGLLVATLLPETQTEVQAAGAVRERAPELTQPITDAAKEAANQVKDALVPAAQSAAHDLQESAAGAVQQTKQHAHEAGAGVADDAKSSVSEVRSQAGS
jgi:hypothetical protein